jgi:K+-sensing histidine kinase KdpD
LSNVHILARSIRTVISNCIHFARKHKGNEGELYINCRITDNLLLVEIGNNSFSIKTKQLNNLFDLEKSESYGTEQIGLAMIKELLHKINCSLVLADHGRESGKVVFQLQVPFET